MSSRCWSAGLLWCGLVVMGQVHGQSPDYIVVKGTLTSTHHPVSWAQCPQGHALRSGGFQGEDIFAMPEESDWDNTPPHQNSWRVKSSAPGVAFAVCDRALLPTARSHQGHP